MVKLYEMTDESWELIADLLIEPRRSGRPRIDDQDSYALRHQRSTSVLLDGAHIPTVRGRPRKRCKWLLADKGYDAEALHQP